MSRKLFFNILLVVILLVGCAPLPTEEGQVVPPENVQTEPTEGPQPAAPQPFEGFPDEYQEIRLPEELERMVLAGEARVLPLPEDKFPQQQELLEVVKDESYLEAYNFDRLAEYAEERRFTAVPDWKPSEYLDWEDAGVKVGLVYDTAGFYAQSDVPVYEVYLFNDRAELRDRNGEVMWVGETGKNYFWTESPSTPEVLTFFVQNGCWLCWNAGGRSGCLICF